MTGVAPLHKLAEIKGPLLPLAPALQRELNLLLEQPGGKNEEIAAIVVAWAFERGLVMRGFGEEDVVHAIVSRDGTAVTARVVS